MYLFYYIKQSLKQLCRNKGMGFTSLISISAMMLVLGIFLIVVINLNLFADNIKNEYNVIEVYIKDSVSEEQTAEIKNQILQINGVSDAVYTTKEEALNIMKKDWGDSAYLLNTLKTNPLPNSYSVTLKNIEHAKKISKQLKNIDGVEDIKYYQEIINKVTKIARFFEIGSIAIMLFLIFVSIVIVSNTVKLTVFARQKEIEIMKYVGASNTFVRTPFILEGIFIGSISAIISALIIYFLYSKLSIAVNKDLINILMMQLIKPKEIIKYIFGLFILIGILVGSLGSTISMKKFLKK